MSNLLNTKNVRIGRGDILASPPNVVTATFTPAAAAYGAGDIMQLSLIHI